MLDRGGASRDRPCGTVARYRDRKASTRSADRRLPARRHERRWAIRMLRSMRFPADVGSRADCRRHKL